MPSPNRPHFGFPFTRTPTGVQVVEQGSDEHIMAQENVVAYCPLGYREDRPEFGWPWPDMNLMPIDPSPLVTALKTFVTGANATVERAQELAGGTFEIDIDIQQTASGDATGVSQGDD